MFIKNIIKFFIIIITFTSLIVLSKQFSVLSQIRSFWIQRINYDYFSFYKMFFLLLLSIKSLLLLFFKKKLLDKTSIFNIKSKNYNLLLIIYSLFILISTIFSEYIKTSLIGFPDRYEGAFSLISYIIVFFIITQIFDDNKSKKLLKISLLISGSLVSVIGFFQFFNMDFFNTNIGKRLITLGSPDKIYQTLEYAYESNQIYSTLYNPNYVGSFIALFLPFTLIFFLKEEKIKVKLIYSLLCLLFFVNQTGSLSRAGMVGIISSFIIITIVFFIRLAVIRTKLLKSDILKLIKGLLYLSILLIVFKGIYLYMDKYSEGMISSKMSSFALESDKLFGDPSENLLKDIKISADSFSVILVDKILTGKFDDGVFNFYDENRQILQYHQVADSLSFYNPHFKNLTVNSHDLKSNFYVRVYNQDMKVLYGIDFVYNDGFLIYGSQGFLRELPEVEKMLFEGREGLGSSRAYIWSRSIPLLKRTFWKGFGPDTYAMYFPQTDYVGKILMTRQANIIIDKPHNMYLQIAINTGILSLIVFCFIMGMFIFQSLKAYLKNGRIEHLAISASVIAFLVAGMFNDSTVSVTPTFYIFLALGVTYLSDSKQRVKE